MTDPADPPAHGTLVDGTLVDGTPVDGTPVDVTSTWDPDAPDPGAAAWHPALINPSGAPAEAGAARTLHHVRAGLLDADTTQTPGMQRFEALSARHGGTERLWLGENHVGAQTFSGDHHHGEAETGIYVVAGHPEFVFLQDGEEARIQAGPGDYIFVPPFVPHREENPHDEPAVVVLARSTQEGIVVNLPSLRG
jgi:uncharacterized RmlC-like cupin family protein